MADIPNEACACVVSACVCSAQPAMFAGTPKTSIDSYHEITFTRVFTFINSIARSVVSLLHTNASDLHIRILI